MCHLYIDRLVKQHDFGGGQLIEVYFCTVPTKRSLISEYQGSFAQLFFTSPCFCIQKKKIIYVSHLRYAPNILYMEIIKWGDNSIVSNESYDSCVLHFFDVTLYLQTMFY